MHRSSQQITSHSAKFQTLRHPLTSFKACWHCWRLRTSLSLLHLLRCCVGVNMKELPTDARGSPAWRGFPDDKPTGFSGTQAIALEKKGSQNLVWQNLAQSWSFFQKKTTRCNLWSHWLSQYSFLSSSFSFPRVLRGLGDFFFSYNSNFVFADIFLWLLFSP